MAETYLTVKEVAMLKGCSEQYIRRLTSEGKLAFEIEESKGRGNAKLEYRIPLTSLDSKLQKKHKRQQLQITKAFMKPEQLLEPPADYESLTQAERTEITYWKEMLRSWDKHRANAPNKAEGDRRFVTYIEDIWEKSPPPFNITSRGNALIRVMYKKHKALYTEGELALIDRRGKHGNHNRKLTTEMTEIFEYYYLDQSRKTVSLCTTLTGLEMQRRYDVVPDFPSKDTFENFAKKIPIPYMKWFREGEEAFIGECAPYIKRMYDDIEPNDIWVGDGHTFDIMVQGKDGKPFRPYLSAFMDVRSRKMTGWVVTDKLCGDATIYALKKGAGKYGTPKMIQVDNGREYLFHDFSGDAGFRKKAKPKEGEFKPPTILSDLNIDIRTSIPKNARAKGIERAFDTVKETFSKLFDGYTGGSIDEKPDRLKDVVKTPEQLITIDEFIQTVDTYITGFYNKQPHRGEGMHGKSPDEVYAELLYEKRVIPKDKLNLMFMRYSKGTMKVGKNGITIKVYGETLQYSNTDLWEDYFGREVYVRYAPDELETVRVYSTDNQFICEAQLETKLSHKASKEEIQEAQKAKREQIKRVKNHDPSHGHDLPDALDLIIAAAGEKSKTNETTNPKVLTTIFHNETRKTAANTEQNQPIDYTARIQHLNNMRKFA